MKKTSRINLFTTLLFFSHNASAIDEFCHLETDENYSLSEEATDCFSGTWTKFLNEKKDADHQTFFSLDEIGQQINGWRDSCSLICCKFGWAGNEPVCRLLPSGRKSQWAGE